MWFRPSDVLQRSPDRHASSVASEPATNGMWQLWNDSWTTTPVSSSTPARKSPNAFETSSASAAADGRVVLLTPVSELTSFRQ